MDPNLFHIDWERTLEALTGIVVLSFFVERAFAILFESRWWISRFEDARVGKPLLNIQNPSKETENNSSGDVKDAKTPVTQKLLPGKKYPLKEALGFALALAICWVWDFDAVSIIIISEQTEPSGIIITAAIIAGGSKGSIALFHNILGIQSSAKKERQELKELDKQT